MKKTAVIYILLSLIVFFALYILHEKSEVQEAVNVQETTIRELRSEVNVTMLTDETEQSIPPTGEDEAYAETLTEADVVEVTEPKQWSSFVDSVQKLSDTALDEICENFDAVGVQCAVIEDGRVAGSYVYGWADRENRVAVTQNTKYRVASLSKLLTSMIFMRLADEGTVQLDGDISDYYNFTVRNPSYPNDVITPKMLMTHTASIIDGQMFNRSLESYSGIPIRTVLKSDSNYSSAQPGTSHVYSNFSAALVGSVCELATNTGFEALAHSLFLDPLEIDGGYVASSIENRDDIGLLYGGTSTLQSQLWAQFSSTLGQTVHLVQGNLTISAVDYAQLLCVLLNKGVLTDGTRLLSEKACEDIFTVWYGDASSGVGLGCFTQNNVIGERNVFYHTGSSYGMYSSFVVDPLTGDGVVVLTSGADYSMDSATEIYTICLQLIRALFPQ